jgi:NAD(P)H-hydrate epimerase
MDVATAAAMRNIDQRTIRTYRVPGIVLMENAGLQLARVLHEQWPDLAHRHITIVTGRGNNGGDGFILARHLWQRGIGVQMLLLAAGRSLRGDARRAYVMARAYGVPMTTCTTLATWRRATRDLHKTDLIVDAMLGTGLQRPATGLYAEAICTVNTLGKPIIAVDIPSGLWADQGDAPEPHIRATHTVTFALPKCGLLLPPANTAVGRLYIADIGIPRSAIEAEAIPVHWLEAQEVQGALPVRRPEAHKGSHGHLLVVAGSPGKTGAAILASRAALRAGAGLVTLALPASLNRALEAHVTEVMTLPLVETPTVAIAAQGREAIHHFAANVQALVVGPGLGTDPDTIACVHSVLRGTTAPIVLDADGLNCLVNHLHVLEEVTTPIILTPHPGEMARLLGVTTAQIQAQRWHVALDFARRYRVWVVLKGAQTVIYTPAGQRWVNSTGNVALATAGTGDVLAGAIGAFLCQGLEPQQAACCGVYLHGLAGDRLRDRVGSTGLIASDVVEELPYAMRALREGKTCSLW